MRIQPWILFYLCAATTLATYTSAAQLKSYSTGVKMSRIHRPIYKGKYATSREIPFQVYIRVFLEDDTKEYCGGAIISSLHILTASHCVLMPDVEKVCVIAGNENRFNPHALKYTVVRQHFYPKTRDEKVKSDIAILTVDRPMLLGRTIHMIKLQPKVPLQPNITCSISGWGKTDDEGDDRNLMKQAKVPIVAQNLCREAYPEDPADDLLCAGFYDTGGSDACKGDSGGPLVCNGLLTGIVRAGKGCGLPKYPGTYTDVRYYLHWIKKIVSDDMRNLKSGNTIGAKSGAKSGVKSGANSVHKIQKC